MDDVDSLPPSSLKLIEDAKKRFLGFAGCQPMEVVFRDVGFSLVFSFRPHLPRFPISLTGRRSYPIHRMGLAIDGCQTDRGPDLPREMNQATTFLSRYYQSPPRFEIIHTMLQEHVIPHGFLTQLHTPPMVHQERALKELYLNLSDQFQYQKFELLGRGQGAVLKESGNRSLEIYRDRVVVKEQPTSLSFDEYLNQVVSIVEAVQQGLKVPIWLVQQSILRFLVPFDEPVIPLMNDQIFKMSADDLERFGRPILGLCLRIEFPPLPDDPTQMQLKVEPFFRDPKMLFLELSTRFLHPLQSLDDLRSRLTNADRFVKERALSFLQATLSHPSD